MAKGTRQSRGSQAPPAGKKARQPEPPSDEMPRERRASTWQRQTPPRRSQHSGVAFVLVPAVVVVVLGLLGLSFLNSQRSDGTAGKAPQAPSGEQAALLTDVTWPTYVARGPQSVKEAYEFAVLRPDVLQYMPCYCGCGGHDGHKSNLNCFVASANQGGSTIAFDRHGATWDICTDIARDAKRLVKNGKSLRDIRAYIDKQYSGRGDGTNTPLPPES